MDRKRIVPIVAVVVIASAIGIYVWTQRGATTADGSAAAAGTVDAEQVQVSSLISGRIETATLVEGDVVTADQPLYEIDARALKLQVDQAKAAVKATKVAYDQAKKHDDPKEDIAAAKAAWEQAKAAEKIALVQLGYATVKAPAAGTVTAVALTTGELATPGKTLATITRTDKLFVRAFMSELDMGAVAVGKSATIVTDAGVSVDGRVTFVASQAQFTPSNVETKDQRAKLVYEVRVEPTSAKGLTSGMPVTVTIVP